MTINKLNLKSRDRVQVIKFPDKDVVLGAVGDIVGKSAQGLIDVYLVWLDEPMTVDGFKHEVVSIPEVCLERI